MSQNSLPQKSFSVLDYFAITFAENPVRSNFTRCLFRFISLFQTIFIIIHSIDLNAPDSTQFIATIFKLAINIGSGFKFVGIYVNSSNALWIIILIASYLLCLVLMIFKTFLTILIYRKKPKNTCLVSFLVLLHTEVVVYPLTLVLSELIASIYFDQVEKFITIKAAWMSITSILFGVNILIALFKTLFCYSSIYFPQFDSRKSSIHLLGILIIKIILPLLHSFASKADPDYYYTFEAVNGVTCLVISLLVLNYTRTALPEYNLIAGKMQIAYDALAVTISIIQLFSLWVVDEETTIALVVMLTPLCVKFYINNFDLMVNTLVYKAKVLTNPRHLAHLGTLYMELGKSIILNTAKENFTRENLKARWTSFQYKETTERSSNISKDDEYICFCKDSRDLLKEIYEKFLQFRGKNTLVLLSYIQLILQDENYLHLYPKAYHLSLELLEKRSKLRDHVAIYGLLQEIKYITDSEKEGRPEKNNFSQSMWMEFTAEQAYLQMKKKLHEYFQYKIQFWWMLKVDKPDVLSVMRNAEYLDKRDEVIQTTWKRYEEDFAFKVPLAFLVYGISKVNFMNSPVEGHQLINRYFLYKQNNRIEEDKHLNQNGSSDYVTMMISGEPGAFGHVLICSESLQSMFGFNHKEVIGQNVKIIMPRFFKERHDRFMADYYKTGKSRLMSMEDTLILGKTKDDDIFPITMSLCVQPHLEQGVMYSALIKRVKDENQYILFSGVSGEIEETSVGIRRLLNLEAYKRIKIEEICQEFKGSSSSHRLMDKQELIEAEEYCRVENERKIDQSLFTKIDAVKTLRFRTYCSNLRSTGNRSYYNFEAEVLGYSHEGASIDVMILKPLFEHNFLTMKPTQAETVDGKAEEKEVEKKKIVETEEPENAENVQASEMAERNPLDWRTRFTTTLEGETMLSPTVMSPIQSPTNQQTEQAELIKKFPTIMSSVTAAKPNKQEISLLSKTKEITQKVKIQIDNSISKKTSTTQRKRIINEFQKIYERAPFNKQKIGFILIFGILLLIVGIIMTSTAYIVFRQSVTDLNYTISVIKSNYERLSAVSQVFSSMTFYQAGVDEIVPYDADDFTKTMTDLRTNINSLKEMNFETAEEIQLGSSSQQDQFYARSVRVYSDVDLTNQEYYLNTFDAINLFIQKLIEFDADAQLLTSYEADDNLQYVRQNVMNDLLISSESIITKFDSDLSSQLDSRQNLLEKILIISVMVIVVASSMIIFTFYVDMREKNRLFRALMAIHPKEIEDIIIKMETFEKTLLEQKEDIVSRRIYSFHHVKSVEKMKRLKISMKTFSTEALLFLKIKQSLLIGLFLIIYTVIFFVKFNTSNRSLSEMITRNDRANVIYQTQYKTVIACAIITDYLDIKNNVAIRWDFSDDQPRISVDAISSNRGLINSLTEDNGEYANPVIQSILEKEVCSYLTAYPNIDCEAGMTGQTLGLLSLSTQFYAELDQIERLMTYNGTMAQAQTLYSSFVQTTVPRLDVIMGAYKFIASIIEEKFADQTNELLNKEPIYFGLEIMGMIILGAGATYFLVIKFVTDRTLCVIIKVLPYQQIIKSNYLKHTIITLFKGRAEFLRRDSMLAGIDSLD